MSYVLIIEDHPKVRVELRLLMEQEGHEVVAVASVEEARGELEATGAAWPDLMLVDVRLPGASGLELVRSLAREQRLPPTVVVSGEASLSEAVEAVQQDGVYDFIEKPFSPERLVLSARNALEHQQLRNQIERLRRREHGDSVILGSSSVIEAVREQAARAALSPAGVLIRGESGTGKELIADALHQLGPRSHRPFVKINCAALPAHLIEDELFGHVRGAFTDARSDRIGVFEEADGGTLLLDEVGDMELGLQGRLLRVLEDGRVRRVGANRDRAVDVRVVAATNSDLDAAVKAGSFRSDLFYRLAQLVISVPPLRDRGSDVLLLFDRFLGEACQTVGRKLPRISPEVARIFEEYRWPGNVRELRNLCQRLATFAGDDLGPGDLPAEMLEPDESPAEVDGTTTLREARRQFERRHIERVLVRAGWNIAAAARVLDVNRSHLHAKVSELGIVRPGSNGDGAVEKGAVFVDS
jgi:DNA-binding NtrC family response regulator